jgi:exopolyphosphatase / guanosine-5'-triphosphate,3'-diphosphate pyrophosphatase
MKKKYAIVDIGSNSTHMDIFEVDKAAVVQIEYKTALNRLGVYQDNIPQTKIYELAKILAEYCDYAKQQKVARVFVFATSPLRKAKNAQAIVQYLAQDIGCEIEVLSGAKEADLVYQSVRGCYPGQEPSALVVDLGGGSLELVGVSNNSKKFAHSFSIGIAKIKSMLEVSRLTAETAQKIADFSQGYIQEQILPWLPKQDFLRVIGTSSLFKCLGLFFYNKKKLLELKNVSLLLSDFEQVIDSQAENFVDKKDIVFIGSVFMKELLKKLNKQQILICPWSIREAYLLEKNKYAD